MVDLVQQCLMVQRDRENGVVLNELPIRVKPGQTMKLRVILEGDIAEVFLDDRYSLATRLPEEMAETRMGICAEGGFAVFAPIRAYALR